MISYEMLLKNSEDLVIKKNCLTALIANFHIRKRFPSSCISDTSNSSVIRKHVFWNLLTLVYCDFIWISSIELKSVLLGKKYKSQEMRSDEWGRWMERLPCYVLLIRNCLITNKVHCHDATLSLCFSPRFALLLRRLKISTSTSVLQG